MTLRYRVTREVEIPMRDGVRLRGDLWLPDDAEPAPTIVIRTPYDKRQLGSDFVRPQHLVNAGYAVVVQDTRGRFASDGDWVPLMWAQEGRDGYDTIEWIAAQSWCDGSVGMAGTSYSGIVQLAAAELKPPHLRAIAPAMAGVARFEREETGGAFWLDHLFGWLCYVGLDWARGMGDEASTLRLAHFLAEPAALRRCFPVSDAPLFGLPGFPLSFKELSEGPVTPRIDTDALDLPILSLGGWFDLYIRSTIGIAAAGGKRSKRHLVVGPWTHGNLLPAIQGQMHFGPAASGSGARLDRLHLAFFDRYLRRSGVRVPRVRYFAMPKAGWVEGDHLPSANEATVLFPADGQLLRAPAAQPVVLHYRFDDPVPTLGGRLMPIGGLMPGPVDQRPLEGHDGVRHFDSQPLASEWRVVGTPVLRARIACSSESIDLVAKLADVDLDGRALSVTEGIARVALPRGESLVTIRLADTAWSFAPGHRLRLQLQTGDFPHFDRNPRAGAGARLELRDLSFTLPI